ncbi:MATE family efflux transporter, partial [Eubacteriales bacterium OttesenSCG-928-M02]|nr:MATE family efflux transporter [Eubacteriales bacterium OttesenSCG-928-M02]
VIAQVVTCLLSLLALTKSKTSPFPSFGPSFKLNNNYVKQILKWSIPIAAEGFLFTFMSMVVSRFVAGFGAAAISAQRIGSQIENLSWLIGGAFSSALTAFVGQNYGARKWERIDLGYRAGLCIMAVWGITVAALMFFGARFLFNVFLPNAPAELAIGVSFLRILSISQLFICFESAAMGAFRGLGQTVHPSVISAVTNISRVILAWGLMHTSLALDGIWLSLTIGSSVRGLWMLLGYGHSARKIKARESLED